MPELPEVHTTTLFLKRKILGQTVQDFWSDTPNIFKYPFGIAAIKKALSGKRIQQVRRMGKYILLDLSGDLTLVVHQKMTGHLLVGKWMKVYLARGPRQGRAVASGRRTSRGVSSGKWIVRDRALAEKVNSYLRFVITFRSGMQLALSDARKFASIYLWPTNELHRLKQLQVGHDALTLGQRTFLSLLEGRRGRVKPFLMGQKNISGIGNIYSDEILWEAGIHPLRRLDTLEPQEQELLFHAMKKVLKRALQKGGSSMSDYRRPDGRKGGYMKIRKVYRQEGKPCSRDGAVMERIKIDQRSSYFCPRHQK